MKVAQSERSVRFVVLAVPQNVIYNKQIPQPSLTTCPINYSMLSLELFQKFSRKDLSVLVIRRIPTLWFAFFITRFVSHHYNLFSRAFVMNSTSSFSYNSISRAIAISDWHSVEISTIRFYKYLCHNVL